MDRARAHLVLTESTLKIRNICTRLETTEIDQGI
jgi:hypothetical protein